MPDDSRLPTGLWVSAQLRRCSVEAVPAVVLQRGDPDRGSLLLKLNLLNGTSRVLTQALGPDGRLAWLPAFQGAAAEEADAEAYVARAMQRDPDLWAIEIEHRDGWHPFEGPVLKV